MADLETCLKIPHVREIIFTNLDNRSLLSCRLVNINLKIFVDTDKILWTRIIEAYAASCLNHVFDMKDRRRGYYDDCYAEYYNRRNEDYHVHYWRKFLDKAPHAIVKDIALRSAELMSQPFDEFSDLKARELIYPHHVAAKFGLLEAFEFITEKTEDFNPKNNNGYAALHVAAENGSFEICNFIIQNVSDGNPGSFYYYEVIYGCCMIDGYKKIQKITPFHLAAERVTLKFANLYFHIIANQKSVS